MISLFPDFNGAENIYPALVLKRTVVFPIEKISLVLEGEGVTQSIAEAHKDDHLIVLLFQKNGDRSEIGVIAKILQHWDLAPSIVGLLVEGIERTQIARDYLEGNIKKVVVEKIKEEKLEDQKLETELEALSRNALEVFKKLVQAEGRIPMMIIENLQKEYLDPKETSDLISANLRLDFQEKIKLLETLNIKDRLEILNSKLANELNIAKTEQKIQEEIEKEVSQVQKEYVLRERMKAIEKELGIFEEQKEYDEIAKKIMQAGLPKDDEKRVISELTRLKKMPPASAEAPYIRTYLEWISQLPWNKRSQSEVDLKKAREIMDKDHYGLEKAKERVLEYLAVQKLTAGKGRGTILCFVGPPGTGKTSVGQSIARALGRNFARISLGGIRDEAEIRGHRRTYVGALPGRIIQGVRNAGTKNPVFMMDEVDKIGTDFRGDPSSALLEVLDPAQNNSFSDHYIEIPFDLSEVFFITTANILDPIPPALRDRMEVIEFPGYTDEEKFYIAKQFLIPRVLSSHGMSDKNITFSDKSLHHIITRYTREAGVRELERKISEIVRKVAKLVAENGQIKKISITELEISEYLGPEEFDLAKAIEQDEIGVATGLAWTPVGGEIIFIETSLVPGRGNLSLTGQLGKTMKESARAALTYIRSKAQELGFDSNFYRESDVHIHVPSGAIPKDGPSSGIAIATALASTLTKRKVKKDVALTGEVTLSGKILKIGGVKEKVLAADRAGIKTIVMPIDNKNSLNDIPETTRKQIRFKFAKHMDEVLEEALI